MNSNPFVSVVMSVYNGGEFLKDAINSILSQSYKNFEFIIINDGSSDNFSEILELYDDERIKVLNNQENKGLVYSLNRGLLESIGKYIVRMDADDISLPNRIEKQVEFMGESLKLGFVALILRSLVIQ
ncbi:glycosyltransferase family 2 protein [Bacteroides sp. PHL 2737]|uniref:glycosyltransferase family 2 protein n=1 Tax=Bacteroides sp. PHL 2737 TaxID=2162637 RepID=UPI00164E1201|nr:glycosyltransferase family 2 protein [Bacteroides sp. PHL 2737]QLK80743.1 glycosyltransferase family 2 protein [Bacteroides sp. PHL 2737]